MNWDSLDILKEISLGEDSTKQFKQSIENADKLGREFCAFSNSNGGIIYIGVKDDNTILGISKEELAKYNQLIANAATNNVKPAIYPLTKVVELDGKILLLVQVPEGSFKPYSNSAGIHYIKSGSDTRNVSQMELLRLFQQSNLINFDETLTLAKVIDKETSQGVNLAKFYTFFERTRGYEFNTAGISVEKALENMNLANAGFFTLAGLLLFANNPQGFKPYCIIRAVSYYGNEISDDRFKDRNDCSGTLDEQFRAAMNFLKNNLFHVQKESSFNQQGSLEIDERALEEAIVNAILHRDYSKNAVIRLLIYTDRVEIISPGSLPNHLTVENILNGNSVIRNPIIVSYGTKILPYSGIGSGVPRIIKNHPQTKIVDDKNGEQFKITLLRSLK